MKIKSFVLSVVLASAPFAVFAEVVNINQASVEALQHYLKGVGQKKAEKIVAYRKEHKEFKSLDEIMEVKGIGKGIYKKIKADLSLVEGKVIFEKKVKKKKKVKSKIEKNKNIDVDVTSENKIELSTDTLKLKVDEKSANIDAKEQKKVSMVEVNITDKN